MVLVERMGWESGVPLVEAVGVRGGHRYKGEQLAKGL